MYQILGVFFGREIPENIKGHRVWLVKKIIIVGQMTQLKSVRFSCIPDAWGVRSFEDKMMLAAKICF